MDPRALVALFFIFVLGVVVISFFVKKQEHPLHDRLEGLADKRPVETEAGGSMIREASGNRTGVFARFADFTRLKLLRAALPTDLRPFFMKQFALALISGAALGALFFGRGGFLGGLVLGGMFPYLNLHLKFKRRMAKMEYDLPTALQFIVNALRAGHALNSALSIVGSEGPIGCREDFAQLNDSLRLGVPISQAFQQMLHRTPSIDLRFMSTAMLIQRETGGNLTEILDRLNSVVLERKRMRGHVKALTGQARMGGYVVGALPFILTGGMAVMNPTYLAPMFNTPLGQYALGVAIFLQVAGFLIMKKITNIKM